MIDSNVLKYRLKAWMLYQQYSVADSHVNRLHNYLATLSLATRDGEQDYENEVIRDLHNYTIDAKQVFTIAMRSDLWKKFSKLIESAETSEAFPILEFYKENRKQFTINSDVKIPVHKVFEPSEFSQALFDQKFTNYIKAHPKTVWYEILLGIPQYEVRQKIIGQGQTDFDKHVAGLQGLDIVKLYAHCNMRMHFFSSIYLFERLEAFITLYRSPGRIKFVDIGCGPATAGLSFIDHLYGVIGQEISFDYIGVDFYKTMLDGAAYFLDNNAFRPVQAPVFIEKLSDLDFKYMGDANGIIINTSYLFASENLDPVELAKDVMNVRKSQPRVPCYLLFQNSIKDENNIKYTAFKKALGPYQSLHEGMPNIYYSTQRHKFSSTSRPVKLEILKID
jgi:hypothetical protein